MPSSWRPRERTRLTCSTGGDVVADIGCRRDVLTCPIVSALLVLPLPPPALPSGSNGGRPPPQHGRSHRRKGARKASSSGSSGTPSKTVPAPGVGMGEMPHGSGGYVYPTRSILRGPWGPRQTVVRTLICPSTHIGFASPQTRFHLKPANQRSIGATTYAASSVSLAPSSPFPPVVVLSLAHRSSASSSAVLVPQLSRQLAQRFYRRRGTKASRAPPCALAKTLKPPPALSPLHQNLALFIPPYRFPIFINGQNLTDSPQARETARPLEDRQLAEGFESWGGGERGRQGEPRWEADRLGAGGFFRFRGKESAKADMRSLKTMLWPNYTSVRTAGRLCDWGGRVVQFVEVG
jgi:hypothetical protein